MADAEGAKIPTDLGFMAELYDLADLVASAPAAMLVGALDQLIELMSNLPPDAVYPVLSQVMAKRPDAIQKCVAEGNKLGARVQHMERTLYVAALFCKPRVQKLTEATAQVLEMIRGRETEVE